MMPNYQKCAFELAPAAGRDEDFIRRVYRAILGRDVEPAGLQDYSDALLNGMSRSALVDIVRNSSEAVQRFRSGNESDALAAITFSLSHRALAKPISARVNKKICTTDVLWSHITRILDNALEFLDDEGALAFFGSSPGWIDGYVDGGISGWVLADPDSKVEIYLDDVLAGEGHCRLLRPEFAGEPRVSPTCGFWVPIDDRALSFEGLNTLRVVVDGHALPPSGKFVSPWLNLRTRTFEALKVTNFRPFQSASFKSSERDDL
jgi:hypothetical protein